MIAPRRLLKNGGSPMEMALLRSATGDGPPAGALERAMTVVDRARGVGAPSARAIAPEATASHGVFEILTWIAIGVAGGALFHGDLNPASEKSAARPEAPIVIAHVERGAQPDAPSEESASASAPEVTTAATAAAPEPRADARRAPAPDAPRRAAREPRTRADVSAGSPKAAAPSLAEEIKLLDLARRALARGDAGAALAALDKHATDFPAGALRPEAALLRVDVMAARGDRAGAAAAAKTILDARPAGPYSTYLQAIVGDAGSGAGASSGGR